MDTACDDKIMAMVKYLCFSIHSDPHDSPELHAVTVPASTGSYGLHLGWLHVRMDSLAAASDSAESSAPAVPGPDTPAPDDDAEALPDAHVCAASGEPPNVLVEQDTAPSGHSATEGAEQEELAGCTDTAAADNSANSATALPAQTVHERGCGPQELTGSPTRQPMPEVSPGGVTPRPLAATGGTKPASTPKGESAKRAPQSASTPAALRIRPLILPEQVSLLAKHDAIAPVCVAPSILFVVVFACGGQDDRNAPPAAPHKPTPQEPLSPQSVLCAALCKGRTVTEILRIALLLLLGIAVVGVVSLLAYNSSVTDAFTTVLRVSAEEVATDVESAIVGRTLSTLHHGSLFAPLVSGADIVGVLPQDRGEAVIRSLLSRSPSLVRRMFMMNVSHDSVGGLIGWDAVTVRFRQFRLFRDELHTPHVCSPGLTFAF